MSRDEIVQLLGACAREVLPDLEHHPFSPTDRLSDLGANSVDRAEIVMMALEKLSLNIPRTEVFGPRNIGELADLLKVKMQA